MSLDGLNIHGLPKTAVDQDVPSPLTGYAGSRPPGPMIYWLGSRGGTPWDRLGGALPVNTNTQPLLHPYSILPHEEKKHLNQNHTSMLPPCEETYCTCARLPVEEDSRGVVLGAERLDVAVAPLEPSPSAVVTGLAEE